MQQLILTTFIIIVIFSALNALANAVLYITTSREKLYLSISIFWFSLIINFILQSMAQSDENVIILLYGYAIIPLNILAYISFVLVEKIYPKKMFLLISVFMGLLTLILFKTSFGFTIRAFPMALATALPLLYTSYTLISDRSKKNGALIKILSIVLLMQGIHCFNFAFFRMAPNAQLWGWPLSYALYQLLATIMPAITLNFYHQKENQRLSSLVKKRTQRLDSVLKQKEQVFKVLAHDILNPVSILKIKLELYRRKVIDHETAISKSEEIVSRITDIINQTDSVQNLDFEIGALALDQVQVRSSLNNIIDLFQLKADVKSIKIIKEINVTEDDYIEVEKSSFENSIIGNLLSNAIKFSEMNSEITVTANKTNNNIEITVTDQGIGIPKLIQENLYSFSKNISREGTQNEEGHGNGMGITKKYVESFKGEISLVSSERTKDSPGFTSFTVSLPTF